MEPAQLTGFLQCCAKWLAGEDARLRRAAVQTLGIIAELEAPHFGKRIRPLIPRLTAVLTAHAVQATPPPFRKSWLRIAYISI